MSRQKPKRNKKYRPRPVGDAPMIMFIHAVTEVFSPIYAVIDEMETEGTVSADNKGRAIYIDSDGNLVDLADALHGLASAYQIFERRNGVDLKTDAVTRLAVRLDYSTAITPIETREARIALDLMRQSTMNMKTGEAIALLKDFQIKEALEKVAA